MCCKPIFCSKVSQKGKNCSRLLELQKVASNAKSCSKVAEHDGDRPNHRPVCNYSRMHTKKGQSVTLIWHLGQRTLRDAYARGGELELLIGCDKLY